MSKLFVSLALGLLVWRVGVGTCQAQEASLSASDQTELAYDWRIDGTITAVAGMGWLVSGLVLKDQLTPVSCRWCATDGFDDTVRDALRWNDTGAAANASNLMAAVVPVAALGLGALSASHDGRIGQWPRDALIVAEAAMTAGAIHSMVAYSVGRARPYTRTGLSRGSDDNVSFYSGHTSWAFSVAVASGMVVSLHHDRLAPLVWGVGLASAAATGWLRIAADRHYATDVLTGAVVGSAVGFLVPYVARRRAESPKAGVVSAVPVLGGGAMLTGAWVW